MLQNYFTLLQIPAQFDVDASTLEKAYISAQQLAHPDRLIGKSDAERLQAVQQSMAVNEAYEALKDPLKRVQHLLMLKGIHVNGERDNVKPSQQLLMETLEMREHIASVKDERDIALLVRDVQQACSQCEDELKETLTQKRFDDAAQLTIKWHYLGKTLEEAFAKQYSIAEA